MRGLTPVLARLSHEYTVVGLFTMREKTHEPLKQRVEALRGEFGLGPVWYLHDWQTALDAGLSECPTVFLIERERIIEHLAGEVFEPILRRMFLTCGPVNTKQLIRTP